MQDSISKLRKHSSFVLDDSGKINSNNSSHVNFSHHDSFHSTSANSNKLSNELKGRSLKSIRRIRQEKQDQDLLHRTVQDAGQFAYGTKMVEVWVWDSVASKLKRPEGGWWIDPYWQSEDMTVFGQFVDTARHDYIAPAPLSPGVGVPGVLWSDLGQGARHNHGGRGHHPNHHRANSASSPRNNKRRGLSGGGAGSGVLDHTFLAQIFDDNQYFANQIAWRDIKDLSRDPDQPPNRRLQVLAKDTDLRWTAGVPFNIHGNEGIVVYYARNGTNLQKLQDPTNTAYLTAASDFVGSCLALRIPRRNATHRRQLEVDRNLRKVKYALQAWIEQGVDLQAIAAGTIAWQGGSKAQQKQQQQAKQQQEQQNLSLDSTDLLENEGSGRAHSCTTQSIQFFKRKAHQSVLKFKGAGNRAPPTFAWDVALFTTIGVLVSILCVAGINDVFVRNFGEDYQVPLGPMGALLGLQFGLTAAPAAQPRNIMVGQVVSLLIALVFAEMELPVNKIWVQQSLSCAVAIGAMAKIGVVNPPAAANAFIFANGSYGFTNLLLTLVGNSLAILCSVLINNFSDNRQYPTSWGIPPICLGQEKSKKLLQEDRDDTVTILLRRARKLHRINKKFSSSFGSNSKQGHDYHQDRNGSEPSVQGDGQITCTSTTKNKDLPVDNHHPQPGHNSTSRQNDTDKDEPYHSQAQKPSPSPQQADMENSIYPLILNEELIDDADEEKGGGTGTRHHVTWGDSNGRLSQDEATMEVAGGAETLNETDHDTADNKPKHMHRRTRASMSDMFI